MCTAASIKVRVVPMLPKVLALLMSLEVPVALALLEVLAALVSPGVLAATAPFEVYRLGGDVIIHIHEMFPPVDTNCTAVCTVFCGF